MRVRLLGQSRTSFGDQRWTRFVPRSMARVSPPVCRERWNLRSIARRWSNVSRATRRMAL